MQGIFKKMSLFRYLTALYLTALVAVPSALISSQALADDQFWRAPQETVYHVADSPQDNLYASFSSVEHIDIDGSLNQAQFLEVNQHLSATSAMSMRYSRADEQSNFVLGYTHNNVSLSMMRGSGDDYSKLSGDYTGVNPYLFHGGYWQKFDVNGYAVDYGMGKFGHLQYGQATVSAAGLLDRKARYLEWSNNRFYGRAMRFARGTEAIGSGLDLGFAFAANKRVAVQTMNLDNDKRMQRIRFEFDGKKSRQYWLDFSAHQNPLFEANNDYRVMFNFRTLLGGKQLASYQNDSSSSDDVALEDEAAAGAKKKSGKGWRRALFIGAGVGAVAALSSSGSEAADEQVRFFSQNDAAFDVLNRINPTSIQQNREYGGWVFMNPDGSYGSSEPVRGEAASVQLPNRIQSTPAGSRITASYHTHAAFDPRFDNENFSPTDLENDRTLGIDGYLATPGGQFKLHDIETDTVIVLGRVATTPGG